MVKEIRFCKFKRLVVWTKGKFGTGEGLLWYRICARCKKQASTVRKRYSVPETPAYGTEYARGAKNRLMWYATRFQRHSVRRTGFCGTEGIFGTGNALLWYGVLLQCA